jgi:hypothetical protein
MNRDERATKEALEPDNPAIEQTAKYLQSSA